MDDLFDLLNIPDGVCHQCSYTGPAIVRGSDPVICYECLRAAAGHATVEWHHMFGKANDKETTVGMLGNFHRELEALRPTWPEAVRKNTNRDPLLWVIGLLYTVRDLGLLGRYMQRAGDWLLLFHGVLVTQYGIMWWEAFGLPPIWGAEGATV